MIHLGRFVLLETDLFVGEGYQLAKSNLHKIIGSFVIYNPKNDYSVGISEVIQVGDTYYSDVYAYNSDDYLVKLINSVKLSFITKGNIVSMDDNNKITKYILARIYVYESGFTPNLQIKKYSISLVADLQSECFYGKNWFKSSR